MEKVKKHKRTSLQKKKEVQQISITESGKVETVLSVYAHIVQKFFLKSMSFCIHHWRFVILMGISVFLRTWDISHISLFGDLARDYIQAAEILDGGTIPLLGIPSSIPRFSQGPFNIWFDAVSFLFGGVSLYTPPLFAAGVTTFGVGVLYRTLESRYGQNIAFVASLLVATSPAAVIQSRAPFYLFAVPLFTLIFLLCAVRVREDKKKSVFILGLSSALMLGWEMATLPIFGLIAYSVWIKRIAIRKVLFPLIAGFILGSFPKILHDLTHSCEQVCGLGLWAVYRIVAVTGFDGKHALTGQRIQHLMSGSAQHFSALFGKNEGISLLIVFILCIFTGIHLWRTKTRTGLTAYAVVSSLLLLIGIGVHGSPSEAYFPPFLVFVPILVAYGLHRMPQVWKRVCILLLLVISIKQGVLLIGNHFYAQPAHNTVAAVEWILNDAQQNPIALRSYDKNAHFRTYLDVFRFLLWQKGAVMSDEGIVYTIAMEDDVVLPTIQTHMYIFGHVTVVRSSMYNK